MQIKPSPLTLVASRTALPIALMLAWWLACWFATGVLMDIDVMLLARMRVVFTTVLGALGTLLMLLVSVYTSQRREQRTTALALAQREQEFRSMVESSPDFIVRYDRDGRLRYVNDKLLHHLGHASADEVIGKRPTEVWPDGRFAELEQAVARAMESASQVGIELIEPTPNGAFRYHQLFVVPERDVSGQIIGTLAFGRDITAIREAERKLANFIDKLPGLAYTFRRSPEGRASYSYVSPSIDDIYGLRPEDVRDDAAPMHAMAHPEDRPRIKAASAAARQALRPFQVEFRVRRPGHPERWIESRSTPERQANGEWLWHGIMLDITGRKRAEIALLENFGRITELNAHLKRQTQELAASQEQLRLAEAWYHGILRSAPDGMLVMDRHGIIMQANAQLEALFGYEEQELIGQHVEMLLPAAIRDMHATMRTDFITSGRVDRAMDSALSPRACRKDGSEFPVDISLSQLPDISGRVGAICATIRDITALKVAEQRLRQSRDIVRALVAHKANEQEKERKYLVHQIHEDLAQNLAAMRMKISMAERCGEPAARAALLKGMHDIAEHSIARIRDIVSVLRPTALDLGLIPALRWLIDDFKGIGFRFDLALRDDILVSDEVSTLLFRATQEALLNIALHAAATRIRVSLDHVDGACHLQVRDNGCGFDPAEPGRDGSFGLIDLTEQTRFLGGDLSVDSSPGRGTVLHIHLPVDCQSNALICTAM